MANDYYYHSSGVPATGSSGSSSTMRTELDAVAAGFDKLPALTGNADEFVVVNAGASALTSKTAAEALTLMGAQASDATLTSLAALGTAADKYAYTTGVDTWAEGDITAAGRAILDDADAAAQRATLGLVIGTDVQAQAIPSGTVMLFMQASAPTGWTQDTTHNNKALRVVSGTGAGSGGATAFTTVFGASRTTASANVTLPAHTHGAGTLAADDVGNHNHSPPGGSGFAVANYGGTDAGNFAVGVNNDYAPTTAASGAHGHTVSGSTATAGSGTGSHVHGLSLDLQYVDIIACSKD